MGSSHDHIRQWKHNRELLKSIPREYPDWLVTVTFYVALHAVDALLAHDKVTRVTSHESRNDVLIRTNRYDAIRKRYLPLYDLSRTVRYLADPTRWVPPDQVEGNVIRRYLYPIESSVQRLMSQQLNLPEIVLAPSAAPVPQPSPTERPSPE